MYRTKKDKSGIITSILEKYPQHKAVLFLQVKYENNETLTTTEIADLERFYKFLK